MSTTNVITTNFVKTYSDKTYIYTATVLHKGVVIALAMDQDRRIDYTVLKLQADLKTDLKADQIAAPLDVKNWLDNPKSLPFSNEIAQVGFGVTDQAVLPVVKKGSTIPVVASVRVPPEELDTFRSSTARLTADAPFQALSDGQYVYVLRQAIAADHADMIFVDQVTGELLVQAQTQDGKGSTSLSGNAVSPIVNATLLVDRFLLVGTDLKPKMEVRFQRSRSKTRPQSRKDSLGARDMEEQPFYEPTQELAFVNHLTGGRFTALLLPTQVVGIQRWQIFAHNQATGLIDAYNIERAEDGLFNTRGSKIYTCPDHPQVYELKGGKCTQPSRQDETQLCNQDLVVMVQTNGYAESALRFEQGTTYVELPTSSDKALVLGAAFTQEAWIYPQPSAELTSTETLGQLLIGSAEEPTATTPPSIWVVNGTQLRIGFGNGTEWKKGVTEFLTEDVLSAGTWNHIAVSFEVSQGYQVYVNGRRLQSPNILAGKQPPATAIRGFGGQQQGFTGILDEVRIWTRSRTQTEIQADMRQRLIGQEPGLIGYWRFDEASGKTVYDQTNNLRHGTHFRNGNQADGTWITSDAPIGEGTGISRNSFRFAGRTVVSGLSALMYFQQEEGDETGAIASSPSSRDSNSDSSGSGGGKKGRSKTNPEAASRPLKQSARVMLAVATQQENASDHPYVTTLDFGVSALGRIAQVPDVLNLPGVEPPRINNKSINEQLEAQESLEAQLLSTMSEIAWLDQGIECLDLVLSAIDAELSGVAGSARRAKAAIERAIAICPNDNDLQKLKDLQTAIDDHATARSNKTEYDRLVEEITNCGVVLYENPGFQGKELVGIGSQMYDAKSDTYSISINAAELKEKGLDKLISSIRFYSNYIWRGLNTVSQVLETYPLEVTVYEKDNQDGKGKFNSIYKSNTDFRTLRMEPDPSGSGALIGYKVDFVIASVLIKETDKHRNDRRAKNNADTKLTEAAGKLDKKPWQKQRDDKDGLRTTRINSQTELKNTLNALRSQLNRGVSVAMPLLHTDATGLSVAGGILNFAWTTDAPLLFDSAIGKLALYFRGSDDQFLVTYYRTLTQRARYTVVDQVGNPCLICYARSTEPDLDDLTITISGDDDPDFCTVTIALEIHNPVAGTTQTTITETWERVPRNPQAFATVLNGQAWDRRYVGTGIATLKDGRFNLVQLVGGPEGGLRRSLAAGSTLLIGDTPVTVSQAVAKGATQIAIEAATANLPATTLPLFWVDYNYPTHARTTALPSDLSGGSRLVYVGATSSAACQNQTSTSGETLACEWVASAPGSTLAFDGKTLAQLSNASRDRLALVEAPGNLTLEAWVRPSQQIQGRARLITQQLGRSRYSLGLLKQDLPSALTFNGSSDYIDLKDGKTDGIRLGHQFTQECWIYPTPSDDNYRGVLGQEGGTNGNSRAPSIWIKDKTKICVGLGDGTIFASLTTQAVLRLEAWNHVAVTFDGGTYRLYINGVPYEDEAKRSTWVVTTQKSVDTPVRYIGRVDTFFPGRIDEVRLWKRVRSQREILADMYKRLGGNETDLIGYWHFSDRKANDYSRYQRLGKILGNPQQAVGPLAAYKTCLQVGEQAVQSQLAFPVGGWTHVAATFIPSYALRINGTSAGLDCGSDRTLEINRDLTIEVFLQVDDLSQRCSLISKGDVNQYMLNIVDNVLQKDGSRDYRDGLLYLNGVLSPSQANKVPYALLLDTDGKLLFVYTDSQGAVRSCKSSSSLSVGRFYRVAVTRRYKVEINEQKDAQGRLTGALVKQVADVLFYVDKQAAGTSRIDNAADAVSDQQSLILGAGSPQVSPFQGIFSEVRLWNTARDAANIGANLTANETGLVSWWQFEENQGNVTRDVKSNNHAQLKGGLEWVKTPDPIASKITLYHNGVSVATEPLESTGTAFAPNQDQFVLGAVNPGNPQEYFRGELEEVRIWRTVRTPEQLQDNLFQRVLGEKEDLIAYYTFDAETGQIVSDRAFRGNHLTLNIDTGLYTFSTAPIGDDTPLARSALAGVRTIFQGLIQSRVGVQEYGDLQYETDGTLIGVLKRCYVFIQDGKWHLLTGFKVGNLITEWLGQVQFEPQLIGYIEGAPPTPSENLTSKGYIIGEAEDYTGGTSVQLTQAQSTTYTYSSSLERTFDVSMEGTGKVGFTSETEAGIGLATSIEESDFTLGTKATMEFSQGWLNEATMGSGVTVTKNSLMALRGYIENASDVQFPDFGRRFVPDNVGFTLVQSQTADVYALRLEQNRALVCYQMRPNPNIPPDWNILTFPINPRYTKQGTLDGKVGFNPDPDYPQALAYSPDSSYFKPIEAYALKNRIQREAEELQAKYETYDAGDIGAYGKDTSYGQTAPLPRLTKRNLVNTYVWTADGGLFAETQETLDTVQEMSGGSYSFKSMRGLVLEAEFAISKVVVGLELEALFGGSQSLTVTKSRDSENSFGLEVELANVEDAIFARDEKGQLIMDTTDPKRPKPKRMAGKVDAYRFMSFYLEPRVDHYDLFFNKIVDPIWLEQSNDPDAIALRAARQDAKRPPCWRILHRVTYVSRVLPAANQIPPNSLEKTMKELDIESNYELIKTLEPFVNNKTSSFVDFTNAARDAIAQYLPELKPHTDVIVQWLCLYYGVVDELALPDEALVLPDATTNRPPSVQAGLDVTVGINSLVHLKGAVQDDRYQPEDLFLTWSQVNGEGEVSITAPHALQTTATFTRKGRYGLRLTASDGQLQGHDEITIMVNQPPVISAGPDQRIRLQDGVQLNGAILDKGLGDETATLFTQWSVANGPGTVTFANAQAVRTTATFSARGMYTLKLTVSNGTYSVSDTIAVDVASRIGGSDLLALYPFAEGQGTLVRNVASVAPGFDLTVQNATAIAWIPGGLTLTHPTLIASTTSLKSLINAIQATNELTLEVWIQPAAIATQRLTRIVTLSAGVATRNFTLGQVGNTYQLGIRTTATNPNASDQVLAAGTVTPGKLTHLVCTRSASGLTQFYVDGVRVGGRLISGDFSNWEDSFGLAVGGEVNNVADGNPRDWLGSIHLLALYRRALTPDEVQLNFEYGDTNLPPVVAASSDRTVVTLPNVITLSGTVNDDRLLPVPVRWSVEPNRGDVQIAEPTALQTTATFTRAGIYRFRFTANDGQQSASSEITVIANQAPAIAITPVPPVKLPSTATLKAQILIPGLGDSAQQVAIRTQWQQIQAADQEATVTFANATALETSATFPQAGTYVLQITADNGYAIATERVTVVVHQAPLIRVPAPFLINLPETATLQGELVNSGAGDGSTATIHWEQISGEGAVTLADAASLAPTVTFSQSGIYTFRLTVDNGYLSTQAEVTIVANAVPVVDAGRDRFINLPDVGYLDGIVSDDGLPNPPGRVELQWSQVSGPHTVTIADPTLDYTAVTFPDKGIYTLRFTASDRAISVHSDRAISVHDDVTLTVNKAPVIQGTVPAIVTFPETAFLQAEILDDGRGNPNAGAVTVTWTELGSGGQITFTDPHALNTTATFATSGRYQVQLTVNNGHLSTHQIFKIISNQAPVVSAGADQVINLPDAATLTATFSDDRLPDPGVVTMSWAAVGDNGAQVTFAAPHAAQTTAQFSDRGLYTLRFTADDGNARTSDEVVVTVNKAPVIQASAPNLITLPTTASLTGEIVDDGRGNPQLGAIAIAWSQVSGNGTVTFADATALNTTVRFPGSGSYGLRLTVQNGFLSSSQDVTIVANQMPVVEAGADQLITLPQTASLQGIASDDGWPNPPGVLTATWSLVNWVAGRAAANSATGQVTFADPHALQTTATFSTSGTYTLRLTVGDGGAEVSDEMTVVTNQAPLVRVTGPQWIPITSELPLTGVVEDDGLPTPGVVTTEWTKVDGEGVVTFANASAVATTARFSQGGTYTLRLTASDGAAIASQDVTVFVASRVISDLIALYTFQEMGGLTIRDVSGVGEPLNLKIPPQCANFVRWDESGLSVIAPDDETTSAYATSEQAATKIIQAVSGPNGSHQISVEVWYRPVRDRTPRPRVAGRIVSIAARKDAANRNRNFTLQQGLWDREDGSFYHARLRTSVEATSTEPDGVATDSNFIPAQPDLTHLVYTWDGEGTAKLYVNGALVQQKTYAAPSQGWNNSLSTWESDYPLTLANDDEGNSQGQGTYHLLAIYRSCLTLEDIDSNYKAGPSADSPTHTHSI